MNWRNLAQMNACIHQNLSALRQREAECVVGVPRSGMLAASLIALYSNLPLTDVYSFCQKRSWWRNTTPEAAQFNRILLVDDSVNGGNAMRAAMVHVKEHRHEIQVTRLAVYGRTNSVSAGYVDAVCEVIDGMRVFEWNLWKHRILMESMVDIDGVLCRDPLKTENDHGPRYRRFIESVEPLYVPTRVLGWICTNRLSEYRDLTATWLHRHGIKYGRMLMNTTQEPDRRAAFKAESYASTKAELFIESDARQAPAVAKISGKPVLCMETREMLA